VQTRAERVVLHLYFRPELTHQSVERCAFSGAHVGGGDDAQAGLAIPESSKLRLEDTDAVPLHKGAQQVDRVCRLELSSKFGTKRRFAMSVGEKCCVGQRRGRADRRDGRHTRPGRASQASELNHSVVETLAGFVQRLEYCVDETNARSGVLRPKQRALSGLRDVSRQDVWLVSFVD